MAFTSQEVKAKVYLAQNTPVIVITAMGDSGTMMDYGWLSHRQPHDVGESSTTT